MGPRSRACAELGHDQELVAVSPMLLRFSIRYVERDGEGPVDPLASRRHVATCPGIRSDLKSAVQYKTWPSFPADKPQIEPASAWPTLTG